MIRIVSPTWLWRIVSGVALIIIALFDLLWAGEIGQFYCLPVAGLAFSDGWRGGLTAAVFCSALVLAMPGELRVLDRELESVALICLGLLVGYISDQDRTQRRDLQTRIEQLQSVYEKVQANFEGMKRIERLSAIGQLSAGLAHEIRNPLASISGAATILQHSHEPASKQGKCLEIIKSECRRLDGLLTNFLNFAKPRPPRLQAIPVAPVMETVLELARHGIRDKMVHCEAKVQADLPMAECDPEQLEQVLLNLTINAIEASPDGATVTLSAESADGKVAVHVADSGYGVAPANVDRLFDPFFTTKEHGTGLGLPVAHQIMTQMGGMLVANPNPDQGMTFSVLLPAKSPQA